MNCESVESSNRPSGVNLTPQVILLVALYPRYSRSYGGTGFAKLWYVLD